MIHACIFDFHICYFEELFFMFHGKQQRSPKLGDEVPVAPMNKKGCYRSFINLQPKDVLGI
ncbi:hypothetical protein H5410_017306 [Solanum commersonii]|uniref:Uncharacterized protein n=1 Tax=Solanum commersonii TaxID=4109 RepID=A0A9J5ZZM3_SOLCO|nr:hypothetical protein H5410_017306 [Solanum commersonii]